MSEITLSIWIGQNFHQTWSFVSSGDYFLLKRVVVKTKALILAGTMQTTNRFAAVPLLSIEMIEDFPFLIFSDNYTKTNILIGFCFFKFRKNPRKISGLFKRKPTVLLTCCDQTSTKPLSQLRDSVTTKQQEISKQNWTHHNKFIFGHVSI